MSCKNVFIDVRVEYYEKSRHLQDRLKELKSEIEVLKVEDKQTSLDRIYEENQQQGNNKYSTLRKVRPTFISLPPEAKFIHLT